MMHITVITSATAILSDLATGFRKFEKDYPNLLTINLFDAKGPALNEDKGNILKQALAKSDFIVVDLRLCPVEWVEKISEYVKAAPSDAQKVLFSSHDDKSAEQFLLGRLTWKDIQALGDLKGKRLSLFMLDNEEIVDKFSEQLADEKRQDFRNLAVIVEYWMYANEEYLMQLLLFVTREYGGYDKESLPEPYQPIIRNDLVIYVEEKRKVYDSLADYQKDYPLEQEKPTIGVLFLGYHFRASNVKCVFQIIERLKPMANVIPILAPGISSIDIHKFKELVTHGDRQVDLLLNFVPFRLGAGPMGGNSHEVVPMLETLGVPMLHPFFITRRTFSEWQNSIQGIDSSEYLTNVMLPELDGAIGTMPVGALVDVDGDNGFDFENRQLVLIEERVQTLLARIDKILTLQRKENKDKKVAIICYNYPYGEDQMFGASFLDTFESATNMLQLLKQEGYTVPEVTKAQLMEHFTAGKLVNSGKWGTETTYEGFLRYSVTDYATFMGHKKAYQDVTHDWGEAPGQIMAEGTDFLVPGIVFGNVFIGLQPARSSDDQMAADYHDKSLNPHHQYIAFYSWLKEKFQADAMIHVGTHGTLEFLKGKEVAMSGDCIPDELVGDIPHVYLYYIGNPSEAMIAKRRSHAVLVSYQTPPYVTSDLYGDYVELEEMLANYAEAQVLDPARCENLYVAIREKVSELHFTAEDIHDIEAELYRMKRSLIPRGLHIFGEGYDEKDARDFLQHVLRYDRGPLKAVKRIIAEDQGKDYDAILENSVKIELEKLEVIENQLVVDYLEQGVVCPELIRSEDLRRQFSESLQYGLQAFHDSRNTYEKKGLLQALNGKYLPVRLAGDIVKTPEVLPSGYNLYQFDPRLIPEKTAAERGKVIAENTIAQYYDEFGRYPVSTGVVLWGFETSRTQGETIGQILHYLGVRVRVARGAFKPIFEIIPIAELGRPRVDVMIHMTGFFRDIFPNVIDDLNELFLRVARLDESNQDNFFKANTDRIVKWLIEEGHSPEEAFVLAAGRIFGPTEGAYSTRVTSLIGERNWEEEQDLAEGYVEDIQYLYGAQHRGKASVELLKAHLQVVDLVSQIRSNLEFEVTDLDHYYEYFGGFSKAVEVERGIKTPIYISDTTGERVQTEGVKKSIERGVRTRLLNPKWIDGLLEHEQHGAQNILDRFENLIGLAATTNEVDSWVFSELHSTFIADEQRKEELTENNRWAYHSMMERLLESHSRGYWEASELELQQLREAYLQLEGSIEEKV